jgi:SAM-dependent methyltransferase
VSTVTISPGPQATGVTFADALRCLRKFVRDLPEYWGGRAPGRTPELAAFLEASHGVSLRGKAVTDMGSGYGAPLLWMCLEGGATRGTAVEYGRLNMEALRFVVDELGLPNISAYCADFNLLEAEGLEADVVTVMDLAAARTVDIEHLIALLGQATRPGGHVVIKGANVVYIPGVRGRGRRPQSQLLPTPAADIAEEYFTGRPPDAVLHAPHAIIKRLERAGFEDVKFAWSNGAKWGETRVPVRARPSLPHWYVAARKAERRLRAVS